MAQTTSTDSILTPGEVYFIREIDVLTGVTLDYVKIGLVKNDRESSARSTEHQVANPRDLDVIRAVRTDCVVTVEKCLHWRYLRDGVRGEWFKFDDQRLSEAIRYAEDLRDQFALRVSELRRGLEFQQMVSSGAAIRSSDDAVHWLLEYQVAHLIESDAKEAQTRFNTLIKKQAAEGADTSEVASIRRTEPTFVDVELLEATEPELWRQYVREKVSGKLNPTRAGDRAAMDPRVMQAGDLVAGLRSAIAEAEGGRLELHAVAQIAVGVRSATAYYGKEKELAGLHLRALCGRAPGIDGICTWKRTLEEEFDLKAFKAEQPEAAARFTVAGKERKSVIRGKGGARTTAVASPVQTDKSGKKAKRK
jgi:hypothetical protein